MSCRLKAEVTSRHLLFVGVLLAGVEHLGEGRYKTNKHSKDEDVEDSAHTLPLKSVGTLRLEEAKYKHEAIKTHT